MDSLPAHTADRSAIPLANVGVRSNSRPHVYKDPKLPYMEWVKKGF